MKTIQQFPFAVLGAGAAFTVLWGVADPMAAYAEVKLIEADGYYIMGDGPEESQSVAKERARTDAKRVASEMAGTYVESISEAQMGQLTRDEIRTISANVLKIQDAEVTPKVLGDSTIQYHCHLKAHVDTSSITQQLQQDRQKFEESVRRNKELEQENARISAELAELKEKFKNATEAEKQEINREVKRNENEFTAMQWNRQGCEKDSKRDYHGAIECFQKAIDLDPSFAKPWNNMGYAYDNLDDYNKAIECYQKAIEIDPKSANPWDNMGSSYKHLGNYDKAIECYQKAIDLDPKDATTWNNMGLSYKKLKDYNKAIECYQKSIELEPEDATTWNNMGRSYDNLEDYNKAIECYQKAIELNPKYASPWNNMGYAYNSLGNYQKAVEAFRKAVDLDPDDKDYQEDLDNALKKL